MMLMKNMQNSSMANHPKGVGGFRPTKDTRSVYIHKKRVVDKQIIGFILFSGCLIIIIGVIITILGFAVIGDVCPFEWNKGAAGCLFPAPLNMTFGPVREMCGDLGATLPIIMNKQENDHVKSQIEEPTWIALYQRDKNSLEFTWPGGKPLNITNGWVMPTVDSIIQECVVIDPDGSWSTKYCNETAFGLCRLNPGYHNLVLVGPVLIACGVLVLILSIEVCSRRKNFLKKNPDMNSDEENLTSGPGTPTKNNQVADGIENPAYEGSTTWKQKEDFEYYPKPKASLMTVVPATLAEPKRGSTSKSKLSADQTYSQEQLELLLSPKNL